MNDYQKELFDKLTPLQQKVCTNVLSGMSNIDAVIVNAEFNKSYKG